MDCFSNPLTADTGTPAKSIPLQEVEEEGGRYNRKLCVAEIGFLPNGNICHNISLWYCKGCSIWFEMISYYCKHKIRGCFASHNDCLNTNH